MDWKSDKSDSNFGLDFSVFLNVYSIFGGNLPKSYAKPWSLSVVEMVRMASVPVREWTAYCGGNSRHH